ncbi:cytoplasmic aconitate hydratase-like isoform X2 [Mercenaria mercenaria]|uniref:cytoplasmic aconitate hydratase-like isoform X2 n=1 Tax=Mercenaria mercenaria TaxID=6596 RepID=UPI00234F5901|nr:cytoplasmic aconitate hydratase-like isoform X2 [Mercenaria mercenaria]
MGIIPFQYLDGQNASSLGLTGKETITIDLPQNLQPGQTVDVKLSGDRTFQVKTRFDTEVELVYFRNGGILSYTVRKILNAS